MTTPQTLKEERFLALPKDNSSKILNDEFIHSNNAVETLKLKSSFPNGLVLNYKTQCHLNEKLLQTDEIKLQFPYRNLYFQARVDRKGNIKKHVELGEYKNCFFYVQFKHNHQFENIWARAGAFNFGSKNQVGVRVEKDHEGNPFLAFRNVYKNGNQQFGCVSIFDISKFNFSKFDTSFTFTHKDNQVNLTHQSNNLSLGIVKLGLTHNLNENTQFASSFSKNFAKGTDLSVDLGLVSKQNKNLTSKFKINDLLKLSFGTKYALDKQIGITASGEIDFKKGSKAFDFNKFLFIPFGIQIDVNC